MIPLSLKIKGLYSYQKEQEIDFQRLMEGQIFGIFGAVGSGKSSLLEAITFALYDETERLNQKDNRSYNMMNLKSNEIEIDFTFRNYDGVEYLYNVQAKRGRKHFEQVSTFKRNAYKNINGEWQPIGDSDASEILGLSYQNFKRTIVIPQGRFQEFLQLGAKDRTTMLKEIFHLDKYEFSEQTVALEKNNNENIQNLVGQYSELATVTDDLIAIKEQNIKSLEGKLQQKEAVLEDKQQEERKQAETKKVFEELEARRREFSDLRKREKEFDALDKEVNSYEYCVTTFKAKLERAEELKEQKEAEEQDIRENSENLTGISGRLTNVEKQFKKVNDEYQNLDTKKAELADYELIIEILKLDMKLIELNDTLEQNSQDLDKADERRKGLVKQLREQRTEMKKKRDALPDITLLTEVKEWYDKKKTIDSRIKETGKEIRDLEKEIRDREQDIVKTIPKQIRENIEVSQDITETMQEIQKLMTQNKKDQGSFQDQLNHYKVQEQLGDFVKSLEEGEPCPLCGALEHPDILDVEDVGGLISQVTKKIDGHAKINALCQTTLVELSGIKTDINSLKKSLDKNNKILDTSKKDLDKHLKIFSWKEYDPDDDSLIKKQLNDLKPLQEQINKLDNTVNDIDKRLESVTKNYEKLNQQVNKINSEIKSEESVKISYINQIKTLTYKEGQFERDKAQQVIRDSREHIKEVDQDYKSLSKLREELKIEKHTVEERLKNIKKSYTKTKNIWDKIGNEITGLLTESPYNTLDEVEEILEKELEVKSIRNNIEQYRQKLYKASEDVKQLEKKTRGKKFDPKIYQKLLDKIQSIQASVKDIRENLGGEKSELKKLLADIKKKAKLEKELDTLAKRAENLRILKNLFKGSGFVNYVSSVFLHNLCNAANERFNQLTRQQLRLEINEKNEFEVRDFLNDGRTRSVKTLSGGQIFQASLSLALALAESVQQQSKNQQNFFFLDEGFGSLDRESLQIVFDTLKSLRKENRIVGIISHVEELQQEIDMYIRVTNDAEKGSLIKSSWGNGM
jgi:DNA repair protein SbcC/Rad50